ELTFEQIANEMGKTGIGMTEPLGFNNTYALVMLRSRAEELGLHTITDLKNHPELKYGLTHEFLDRQDGWRPLAQHYQLNPQTVIGIDRALGYGALGKGSVDVKDAYSTDAKISENDLVVLEDDRQFFPQYKAVFLFRYALPTPAIEALRKLEGTIEEAKMTRLNAEAERTKNYTRAANLYFEDSSGSTRLRQGYGVASNTFGETFPHKLARWTARHLELAAFSLLLSVLVGIPLGIFASRGGAIGHAILGFAGIKTSAVLNVGTATLAALIGAGGLGEPILSGLNLNDHATILQGAIPAAILALLVQSLFDLLDRVLIPKGLRL